MKTGPDLPGRGLDILFIAKEHLGRLKGSYLDGPADLVVEITSAESRLRDRGEKFAEYELGGATFKVYKFSPRLFAANGAILTGFILLLLAGITYGLKSLTDTLPLFIQAISFYYRPICLVRLEKGLRCLR